MMRRYGKWLSALATGLVALVLASSSASANCNGNANNITVTVSPGPGFGNYDPFSGSDLIRSLSVTVTNNTAQRCDAAISFQRTAASAVMTSGTNTLNYAIEQTTGGSTLVTTAGYVANSSPPAANRIAFGNVAAGTSVTRTFQIRIPQAQVRTAGAYTDSLVTLQLIGLNNAGTLPNRLVKSQAFTPTAAVIAKCSLPAPSLPTMNFNSAISNGHPNPGVVQTATFSNVQCTAPSRLRLTGAALQPVTATGPRSGFDNFINFKAAGTFGAAAVTLTTANASQSVDSASKNAVSGATTNGFISVGVNLVNGNPIIAGTYSGVLTVTIDPAL